MDTTEKKKKHYFHANKVDRIAIVDRPAVPDAEILIFKREKKETTSADVKAGMSDPEKKAYEGLDGKGKKKYMEARMAGADHKTAMDECASAEKANIHHDEGGRFMSFAGKDALVNAQGRVGAFGQEVASQGYELETKVAQTKGTTTVWNETYRSKSNPDSKVHITTEHDAATLSTRICVKGALTQIMKSHFTFDDSELIERIAIKREAVAKKQLGDLEWMIRMQMAMSNVQTICSIVESCYWQSCGEGASPWQESLDSISPILEEVLSSIPVDDGEVEKAIKVDIQAVTDAFNEQMNIAACAKAFEVFKQAMYSLVINADEISGGVTEIGMSFLESLVTFINAHSKDVQTAGKSITEKSERIPPQRLARLEEVLKSLKEVAGEVAIDLQSVTEIKEEKNMDETKIKALITEALAPVLQIVEGFKSILTEKGIIEKPLTDEEKKAKEEVEKKQKEEADKLEAEKKAKDEADKVEAEKKAKEEAEKKAKEEADAKAVAEKREAEFVALKARVELLDKALVAFEKRTGVKVSLDVAEKTQTQPTEDIFGDALKGKKKS